MNSVSHSKRGREGGGNTCWALLTGEGLGTWCRTVGRRRRREPKYNRILEGGFALSGLRCWRRRTDETDARGRGTWASVGGGLVGSWPVGIRVVWVDIIVYFL